MTIPEPLTAAFIADLAPGTTKDVSSFPPATGVAFHTARVRPGDAFFALPGATTHGLAFADAALAKGAAFVISDRPHPRGLLVNEPASTLMALGTWARARWTGPVIGVTGSAGKTSLKAFLAAALDAPSSPGNLNTPWALACILVNTYLEGKGKGPLVLELGIDHVGEMASLVELVKPSHALLTLVAASHLEGLGTVETVAREKAELLRGAQYRFASLQAAAWLEPDLRTTVETYDLTPAAFHAGHLSPGAPPTLHFKDVAIPLIYPGKAMGLNSLGALVVAEALGVPIELAATRLASARLEPGRLELKKMAQGFLLDDSYNSNPASAAEAISVLRSLPDPHTAILGDMLELGERSAELHESLGTQTVGLDKVIAIGTEARRLTAGNPAVQHFASFGEALPVLAELPLEGTVLIKASRGMRFERIVEALQKQEVLV